LKKDIKPYEKGLSEIDKIRTVMYRFNGMWASEYAHDDDYTERIGIIAQELEAILPHAIDKKAAYFWKGGPEETVLHVNIDVITYTMINAIKELSAKIKDLKKEVDDLNLKVKTIKNNLNEEKGNK
jgi:hypothetical protein